MNDDSSLAVVVGRLRTVAASCGPGGRLPSSRILVQRWGISPVTLSRAVTVLMAEGMVISRPGAGVFVTDRTPRPPVAAADLSWQEDAFAGSNRLRPGTRTDTAAMLRMLWTPPDGVIDLSVGYLHETLQPTKALADAMGRAGRRPGTWTRSPAEGIPELRAWFADDIGGRDGPISANDVLISSGGQTALVTALRALTEPGQSVLVESPTYPGTLAAAAAAGLRSVPVPLDADGLRVELLAESFANSGARVLVCQPLFHNPTGTVLAPDRRARLMDAVRAARAFVIEDDFTRRLVHDDAPDLPQPLAADDPYGQVVHIRSLTKPTSPSLRVTAITARGPAYERLRDAHVINSFFVPRPLQETALELMTSPAYATHLRRLSTALRVRRETTVQAVANRCPHLTLHAARPGGYHLWASLPEDLTDDQVVAESLHQGVAISAGSTYYPPGGPTRHLRLSYVSPASTEEIAQGLDRLDQALRLVGGAC
ncbi:DNA-binding transcriptional MocR family regulator [Kribbella amoyensis]|uniref:DNA-binding transcriptional MocR family regulator n=1 Tax=Kribbella amoyensis TaxID=996641 RepID=A0A561BZN8_9ACTN|nr:PLP-dependent aminotransferase family protein [Kribbella amoyensis]TWD84343.1 DNA-binding transcriptional MocR family regulator [Kribbella amoyensis]